MSVSYACLLLGALVAAPSTQGAAKASRLKWNAEVSAGLEYDSNATRLDAETATDGDLVHAGLFRGQGLLNLSWRPHRSFALGGGYELAGKVFFQDDARSQDTLIHRLTLLSGFRLGKGLLFRLHGLYHEGFQREPDPNNPGAGLFDFRLLDGNALVSLTPLPSLLASVGVGVQRFVYKPNEILSFDAVVGVFSLVFSRVFGRGARESELDVTLGYSIARREFNDQMELLCTTVECEDEGGDQPVTYAYPGSFRRDVMHRLLARITWVRGVLISAGYLFDASRSNSYGLSYLRHDISAKLVAPLFWKIYGTVQLRVRLLSAKGIVSLPLELEDENRSYALVQLERVLVDRLRLVLRYTLFVGDLEDPQVEDLRHLVFLGCAYRYEGR